jgi:glycosyltransferase involved in cell wall biosynthesis
VQQFYRAADVAVYPYQQITTSGALMTGVAHRKAIVATTLPPFREVLDHGQNALLADYGDEQALGEALITLIRDPALRERLAAAASSAGTQQCSWSKIAELTIGCYESLH